MVLRTAVLLAVLFAGAAAAPQPDVSGPANQAFVNPAATADLAGQAEAGVEAVLSYTFSDVDGWRAAVRRYSTGNAATLLQNQVTSTLPTITQQQITAATTVVGLGVRDQRGDQAEVLAFVNTSTTRPGKAPIVTASSVVLHLRRGPQAWLISDLQVPR
jgi:Mce-associated membrane protein